MSVWTASNQYARAFAPTQQIKVGEGAGERRGKAEVSWVSTPNPLWAGRGPMSK